MTMMSATSSGRTTAAAPRRRASRPLGTWVMLGVPLALVLLFVWQIVAPLLKTEIQVREPVSISRISLESDPTGARVDFVVVDRAGQETTVNGDLTVKVREPDGAVWQTSRTIAGSDFSALPSGGLLAGRVGYSIVVATSDWARPPRHAGSATVTLNIQPASSETPLSSVAEERFP